MQTSRHRENNQGDRAVSNSAVAMVGRAAKYAILPGIIPRLRSLSFSISKFFFVFTRIFAAVGLIDPAHPCAQVENIGRYRFTDILGLAYYNLLQDKKNPQKILMFVAVVGTLLLSLAIFIGTIFMTLLSVQQVHAQYFGDPSAGGVYEIEEDFAYAFLGEVFGNVGANFWAGHGVPEKHVLFGPILRAMFATYSQGLMLLAVLIVIVLIIYMIIESARTGIPFGKSFNTVWAPFRIALGICMLVPFGNGYNAAQLMVFQTSQWGSALATNIWIAGLSAYGNVINSDDPVGVMAPDSPDHPATKLIRASQPKPGYNFMRGVYLTYLCRDLMNLNVFQSCTGTFKMDILTSDDDPYDMYQMATVTNGAAAVLHQVGNVALTGPLGSTSPVLNADYCGAYEVPDPEELKPIPMKIGPSDDPVMIGELGYLIATKYAEFYKKALDLITPVTSVIASELHTNQEVRISDIDNENLRRLHVRLIKLYKVKMGYKDGIYFNTSINDPGLPDSDPDKTVLMASGETAPGYLEAARMDGSALLNLLQAGKKYGWASAGSVMMTLASVNNIVSNAVNAPPVTISAPRLMSNAVASPFYRNESAPYGGPLGIIFRFLGISQTNAEVLQKISEDMSKGDSWFAARVYDLWTEDINGHPPVQPTPPVNPPLQYETIAQELNIPITRWDVETKGTDSRAMTATDTMFETTGQGLLLGFFKMGDQNVNPLAQIVALGADLFSAAVAIIGVAAVLSMLPGAGVAIMKIAMALAVPLTVAAYVLVIILPLTLFANFLFAVIEWVLSIFEAVVGMPLWALSMISISGNSLGPIAMNGIKSMFEILVRPTVIIVTTIGSLIIFSASVHFFNKTYSLFMLNYFNTTSDGIPGIIKNDLVVFGSIFLYVLTVYSLGNSCFKMIPTIANNVARRWIGTPKPFSDTFKTDMDRISGIDNIKELVGYNKE